MRRSRSFLPGAGGRQPVRAQQVKVRFAIMYTIRQLRMPLCGVAMWIRQRTGWNGLKAYPATLQIRDRRQSRVPVRWLWPTLGAEYTMKRHMLAASVRTNTLTGYCPPDRKSGCEMHSITPSSRNDSTTRIDGIARAYRAWTMTNHSSTGC